VEKAQKIVHNGTLLDFEEKVRSRRHKAGPAARDAEAALTRAKEELELFQMAPNMADAALATSERRDRSPSPWEPMITMGVPHGHLKKAAQISLLAQ
jgi:hypothetical protein